MVYWHDQVSGYLSGLMIDEGSTATHIIIRAEDLIDRPEEVMAELKNFLPQTEAQANLAFEKIKECHGTDPALGQNPDLFDETWSAEQAWVIFNYISRMPYYVEEGNANDIFGILAA